MFWLCSLVGAGARIVIPQPWNIDPNSVNYTWPWVYSYCLPCQEKVVGTCFIDGCYDWRGNVQCRLTRCICDEGFCADTEGTPGLTRCTPQICKRGPRPLPYVPAFAVRLFHWLGGEIEFPRGTVDPHDPRIIAWVVGGLLRNSWLCVLGVMAVILTAIAFWQYKPPHKRRRVPEDHEDHLKHARASPEGNPQREGARSPRLAAGLKGLSLSDRDSVLIIEEGADGSPAAFHKVYSRPRARGLLIFVVIVAILCGVGTRLRDANWSETMDRVHSLLELARGNAEDLKALGNKVQRTCNKLNVSMHQISNECTKDPVMSVAGPAAINATAEYVEMVDLLHSTLKELPGMVRSGKRLIESHEFLGFWVPLLPVLLVAFVTGVMISEALVVTCIGSLKFVVWLDQAMRVAIVPYTLLVMLITAFCLLGFTMASLFSSFCVDVDRNVLSLVGVFTERRNLTDVYDLSRFYIEGWGNTNPALSYAKIALQDIDLIYMLYKQFEGIVNAERIVCPPLQAVDVDAIVREAKHILKTCTMLLQPANLYPFYDKIVREALCRDLVSSLANFPVFTLLIGLAVFPVSAVFTHRYLVHWMLWKQSQVAVYGAEDPEDQDYMDPDSESEVSDVSDSELIKRA